MSDPDWITNYDELQEYVADATDGESRRHADIVAMDDGIIGTVLQLEGSEEAWIYSDYAVELGR